MKTDRELLELAALAYGFELGVWDSKNKCWWSSDGMDTFDSLQDDGDALRLVVDLKLDIKNYEDHVSVWYENFFSVGPEYFYGDPKAATRRAITRAAAEIGKTMEQKT